MRISFEELKDVFYRVLRRCSFSESKASVCAHIFAENSRDGVYSHGLNRFPVFVKMVKEGWIHHDAEPELVSTNGVIEHWDGKLGPGMYNAHFAMERAIGISRKNGMGMVTFKNTNHWMRGGTYGWQAADTGCVGICTTNTIANMPPWGGKEPRLGNNPLVIAVPHARGHVVLDMAVSQFSYGALQEYSLNKKKLPVPGGYDENGKLSQDPSLIYRSHRVLPVGFWKGSGLSLVLDVLLTSLTEGNSVKKISEQERETGISQLFIAIHQPDWNERLISEILSYTKTSALSEEGDAIAYPGENTLRTRKENLEKGIPVQEKIWKDVNDLLVE
jgi:3-dehydro-L-gulonate 2-dehydrogenase